MSVSVTDVIAVNEGIVKMAFIIYKDSRVIGAYYEKIKISIKSRFSQIYSTYGSTNWYI